MKKRGRPPKPKPQPKEVPIPKGLTITKMAEDPRLTNALIIRTSDGGIGVLAYPAKTEPFKFSPEHAILAAARNYGVGIKMLYRKHPENPKEEPQEIGIGFILGRPPETPDEAMAVQKRKQESDEQRRKRTNMRNALVRREVERDLAAQVKAGEPLEPTLPNLDDAPTAPAKPEPEKPEDFIL